MSDANPPLSYSRIEPYRATTIKNPSAATTSATPDQALLDSALEMPVADALWMLNRQRAFGEFIGTNGGSPVSVNFVYETSPTSTIGANGSTPKPYSHELAMETAFEAEPVLGGSEVSDFGYLAVEAGRHFARIVRRARGDLSPYLTQHAVRAEDLPGEDEAAERERLLSVGRVVNGFALYDWLKNNGATGASENDFMAWFEASMVESDEHCWVDDRLEYQAEISHVDGPKLTASEFHGRRLDWYHFDLDPPAESASPQSGVATPETSSEHGSTIPTRISYPGMPSSRLYRFEDNRVRFGDLSLDPHDLATPLLLEYALTTGDDWFIVPFDVDVGTALELRELRVKDTFHVPGDHTFDIPSSVQWDADAQFRHDQTVSIQGFPETTSFSFEPRPGEWAMFTHHDQNAELFYLPATLISSDNSESLDEVLFQRDEMANVVFAIEQVVPSSATQPLRSSELHQQRLAAGASQRLPVDTGDAQLIYRLQTYIPEHWHPLVPVADQNGNPFHKFELQEIQRTQPDGTTLASPPRSAILWAQNGGAPRFDEEEIPRTGTRVQRKFQLTRWVDGQYHAWVSRRRLPGEGEIMSGLRYDALHHLEGSTDELLKPSNSDSEGIQATQTGSGQGSVDNE